MGTIDADRDANPRDHGRLRLARDLHLDRTISWSKEYQPIQGPSVASWGRSFAWDDADFSAGSCSHEWWFEACKWSLSWSAIGAGLSWWTWGISWSNVEWYGG